MENNTTLLAVYFRVPPEIDRDIWQFAPRKLPFQPENEVHIWLWSQKQNPACTAILNMSLNPHEKQQAAKFRTQELRDRYIVRRGFMRHVLGNYLNKHDHSLTFEYGANGKPFLSDYPLHFNVSHSEDFAMMGISRNFPMGVDIEAMLPLPDLATVATYHFSPSEQADLRSLPQEQRLEGFYNCWTRKEAFIKADGRGLSIPLDSFDVTLKPDEMPHIKRIGGNSTIDNWTLQSLPVPEGYKGAIAAQHPIEKISFWTFTALNIR